MSVQDEASRGFNLVLAIAIGIIAASVVIGIIHHISDAETTIIDKSSEKAVELLQ